MANEQQALAIEEQLIEIRVRVEAIDARLKEADRMIAQPLPPLNRQDIINIIGYKGLAVFSRS